jgi:plastocyanin
MIVLSAAVALVAVPAASAKTALTGTVGPGFVIKLSTTSGKAVTSLKAGIYVITVTDKSTIHNFHLIGKGLNKEITSLGFTGRKTVVVTLKPGKVIYQCDPHKRDGMKASFTVTP